MMYLFITPILLLLLSYLVRDKDIVEVSRYISFILFVDIFSWLAFPNVDYYYLRSALIDIAMFFAILGVKNSRRFLFIVIPISLSLFLNLYEHISYYQTIFYPYRQYIQFGLMQIMLWGLIVGCRWRNVCNKTHTQK